MNENEIIALKQRFFLELNFFQGSDFFVAFLFFLEGKLAFSGITLAIAFLPGRFDDFLEIFFLKLSL